MHTQDGAGWAETWSDYGDMLQSHLFLDLSSEHKNTQQQSGSIFDWYTDIYREICSPQAHQERAYQKFCATKAVEKAQQQEGYYEQLVAVNQSEMACILKLCNTACMV